MGEGQGTLQESRRDLAGRCLGGFVVERLLTATAAHAIYLASQETLGRTVAIKVLRSSGASRVSIERFLREARLAAGFDHPYAAHVYDFGAEDDGVLWISMELVHGTSLADMLRAEGTLGLQRAVPLVERIAEVVHTAHEHGIIHRDLKPSNVMVVSRAGRLLPKLLDFGVAKALGDGAGQDQVTALDELPSAGPGDTRSGQIVGSPGYMAPEQWLRSRYVDARTDVYLLGVMIFELLTGRLPFVGETLREIAAGHLRRPMPAMGDGVPAAVQAVVERAMAKRADDRFSTVIELTSALRVAAGLQLDAARLPRLEQSLSDALTRSAPQPLADAVAQLAAARSVHQALEGVELVAQVGVHYVAMLAMAARATAGSGTSGDAGKVTELLEQWRRRPLADGEMLELSRELVRPWSRRPQAHPIPELVGLFFAVDGAELDAADHALWSLTSHERAASEERALELLSQRLAQLTSALHQLSFSLDYPLVSLRGGAADVLTGTWRPPGSRLSMDLAHTAPAENQPLLVDRDGGVRLMLWPLVQQLIPAPGQREHLFLFRGPGRRGARLVATPHLFEREDPTLWDWLEGHLPTERGATGLEHSSDRAPYRGLLSFTEDDADTFVGRERDVESFVNQLRVKPMIALVGPSGVGKSSFLRAGVVPSLPADWRVLHMRPGGTPMSTLAAQLRVLGVEADGDPDSIAAAVKDRCRRDGGVLVIVVDQLEELFTLSADADARHQLASILAACARSADDPVRVVLSMRDDFLARSQQLPGLQRAVAEGLTLLTTPPADELRRILVEPAQRRGYEFDDPSLPSEMAAEVAEHPGALPLLSFTAARLWERRDRQMRRITRRSYREMNGVAGTLGQHATETLSRMTAEQQRLVRVAFRHLVTAVGTRNVIERADLTRVLGGDRGDAVVERLIESRMLVASERDDGNEQVEIIHEALLEGWPQLVSWRREDAEGARMRDQLRTAAQHWDDRGRPTGLLWRGDALAEYKLWRKRYPGELARRESDFVGASNRAATSGRRWRRFALAAAIGALATALIVVSLFSRRADEERNRASASARESRRQVARLLYQQGRQAVLAGDSRRALAYLSSAHDNGEQGPALELLIASAMRTLDAETAHLEGHGRQIPAVRFSPDGRLVLTGSLDGSVRVWDSHTGEQLWRGDHEDRVQNVAWADDGERFVSVSYDHTARWWRLGAREPLLTLTHDEQVFDATLIDGDTRLVTQDWKSRIHVWDLRTGELLHSMGEGNERIIASATWTRHAAVSADGKWALTSRSGRGIDVWRVSTGQRVRALAGPFDDIAAVDSTGTYFIERVDGRRTVRFRDASDGRLLSEFHGHTAAVVQPSFSPDDQLLLTFGDDNTAHVLRVETGEMVAALTGHRGAIRAGRFAPDGKVVVTASDDGTARLWEAKSGLLLATLAGSGYGIYRAVFSQDGRRVVTTGSGGEATVWRTRPAMIERSLAAHPEQVWAVCFDGDGDRLVTGGSDGARLWRMSDGQELEFIAHDQPVIDARFSPSGAHVVTASGKVARLWDAKSGELIRAFEGHTSDIWSARFRPDGHRLVTASDDHTLRVWDVDSGKELQSVVAHDGAAFSAVYSPDGSRLVTAGADHLAHVWDAADLRRLGTLRGHRWWVTTAQFTNDGSRIITTSSDRSAQVWSTTTFEPLHSMLAHENGVLFAAVTAADDVMATAGQDRTVRLWDASNGDLLATMHHNTPVGSVAFSPDGHLLASADMSGAVVIWNVSRDAPEDLASVLRCRVPFELRGTRLYKSDAHRADCPETSEPPL